MKLTQDASDEKPRHMGPGTNLPDESPDWSEIADFVQPFGREKRITGLPNDSGFMPKGQEFPLPGKHLSNSIFPFGQ